MKNIKNYPDLKYIEERILHFSKEFNRTLPEMRFFVLDADEFISLLEKKVYPVSPPNLWEGKSVIDKKLRSKTGKESGIYYEVVQTGNPSYAYLNENNSNDMQASVIAHVVGHCEFSELNVMGDSDEDRTEKIIYLSKKVDLNKKKMGEKSYFNYWNSTQSIIPLISPNSQYNLENSIETDESIFKSISNKIKENKKEDNILISETLEYFIKPLDGDQISKDDEHKKLKEETISRKGYRLKAPCQDIFGFLRLYAPTSDSERSILDYVYKTHEHHDFVGKTQIMNEGWAMYWEKKIMTELFKERTCKEIIDYAKVFSGVCYPRPFYQRNPYHLGYNMWNEIEKNIKEGKYDLSYLEIKDKNEKLNWKPKTPINDAIPVMEHLVGSITDYEFLRRYLTDEMIEEYHLNKVPLNVAISLEEEFGILRNDDRFAWVGTEKVKEWMLDFFTDFMRPRIYIIDSDYKDGGLLLYNRHNDRPLKTGWIKPTLMNINYIWKGKVLLLDRDVIHCLDGKQYTQAKLSKKYSFDEILEKMSNNEKIILRA
jgi:stage V sporulation protein R